MTQLEHLSRHLGSMIDGQEVLEVACGSGDFSLIAARSAAHVACIDLDTCRLQPAVLTSPGVTFQRMDNKAETVEVKVIFNIALDANGKHLDILQEIMGVVANADVMRRLVRAETSEQIIKILKQEGE